jgi:hypothetical protein
MALQLIANGKTANLYKIESLPFLYVSGFSGWLLMFCPYVRYNRCSGEDAHKTALRIYSKTALNRA